MRAETMLDDGSLDIELLMIGRGGRLSRKEEDDFDDDGV